MLLLVLAESPSRLVPVTSCQVLLHQLHDLLQRFWQLTGIHCVPLGLDEVHGGVGPILIRGVDVVVDDGVAAILPAGRRS